MTEFPLIMTAESVRALLAGEKTQTRRVITRRNSLVDGSPCPASFWEQLDFTRAWIDPGPSPAGNPGPYLKVPTTDDDTVHRVYSRYWVGDIMWVKEVWDYADSSTLTTPVIAYKADREPVVSDPYWHSPIFMKREHARIVRPLTAVRPERLQEISDVDLLLEGIDFWYVGEDQKRQRRARFINGWNHLNAKRGYPWEANNWVWVYWFPSMKEEMKEDRL